MKILVYAGNGGSGGLRGYIKGFISSCYVDKTVNVVVLCTNKYYEYIEKPLPENVKVIKSDKCSVNLKTYISGNRLDDEIIKIIDNENPDIVYYMNSIIHEGTEKYVNIVGMHNQLYIDKKQLYRQKMGKTLLTLLIQGHFVIKSLKKADAVVFDSIESMNQCKDSGHNFTKGIVAYFGVEDNERTTETVFRELKKPTELLYVSTIFPYKNQVELVRGVKEIKRRGYDIKLHLVGSGPKEYVNRLKEEINQLDLKEDIILYSWVNHNEIKQMIDDKDIFVYASSIETSGFGLMEGMVRGAIIMCNNESCMPEILKEGGVLFDVHNPKSIADTFEYIIDNSEIRKQLSNRALQDSSAYTWDNHAQTIFKEFKTVLEKKESNE